MTDVLIVSLGTTLGLKVGDRRLADRIERAGASVELAAVGQGAAGVLRRGYPVNDFVEAFAARRTARTALRRSRPRAVIFSATTTSMLAPRLDVPFAVRLDSPAALNRPGLACAPLRALERSRLAAATLVLPWGQAGADALPAGSAPAVVVPSQMVASGPAEHERTRERLAVAYTPDPKAKGLDLVVAGFGEAAVEGARLAVYGVEPDRARAFLRERGVAEPPGLDLHGFVPEDEFRSALRHAHAFVSGARWEDYGQAPLEALIEGALVATLPAGGAYEALTIARELEPALVGGEISAPALAPAIAAAFALPDERVATYRRAAGERLAHCAPDAITATLRERVLPALLP